MTRFKEFTKKELLRIQDWTYRDHVYFNDKEARKDNELETELKQEILSRK